MSGVVRDADRVLGYKGFTPAQFAQIANPTRQLTTIATITPGLICAEPFLAARFVCDGPRRR
jgi:hypothetical protein